MGPYIYWLAGDARYREHARRSNEAQAAAWRAAGRALWHGAGRTAGRFLAGVAAVWDGLRRHQRQTRNLRELVELDDRILHDIGLERADLWQAARQPEQFRRRSARSGEDRPGPDRRMPVLLCYPDIPAAGTGHRPAAAANEPRGPGRDAA